MMFLNPHNLLGFAGDYGIAVNGTYLHENQIGKANLRAIQAKDPSNIFVSHCNQYLINFNLIVSVELKSDGLSVFTQARRVTIKMNQAAIEDFRDWLINNHKKQVK